VKWLLVLAGAVLLLLGAWFLIGGSGPSSDSGEDMVLEIPPVTAGKPAIIKAAQQFLKIDPHWLSVREGCLLLVVVATALDDGDWPQVQAAAFRGFHALQAKASSRERLESCLETLMGRFARFGSVADLEAMIQGSHSEAYWKEPSDRALLAEASKEIPASASEETRLSLILEASVRQKDYLRAGEVVSKARFAEGVAEAVRAPIVRLESALRLYFEA
jgi:hypothetical protein